MQPFIHESGNSHANKIAQKAQTLGLTTMFNDDAKVSVTHFPFYRNYSFFDPETDEEDEKVFATLVRECIHFEIETIASMLTFGFDVSAVYPKITLSYMFNSAKMLLMEKYSTRGINNILIEAFTRDLVENVYKFIRDKLVLPDMSWVNVPLTQL